MPKIIKSFKFHSEGLLTLVTDVSNLNKEVFLFDFAQKLFIFRFIRVVLMIALVFGNSLKTIMN